MKRILLLCMMMFSVLYAHTRHTEQRHGTAEKPKTVRTIVSDIRVSASGKTVIVNWSLNPDALAYIKELLIFRSSERISSLPSISPPETGAENTDSVPELLSKITAESTEYIDTAPKTGKTYYYAVAARKQDGTIYGLIIPALNASIQGVSIDNVSADTLKTAPASIFNASGSENKKAAVSETEQTAGDKALQKNGEVLSPVPEKAPEILRSKPLPALRLFPETPPAGTQKTSRTDNGVTGGKKAEKGTAPLASGKEPDILPPDINDRGIGGDDYSLFVIVDGLVKTKKWKEAENELKRFLQINRSEETTARAKFYLGQSLYFNGKYKDALSCFQSSRRLYPVVSKMWSTETLDAYRID